MTQLRHSRLLVPVMTISVFINAANSVLMQTSNRDSVSFLNIAIAILFALLGTIGFLAIAWKAALKWPIGGGLVLMIPVFIVVFSFLPYYFSEHPANPLTDNPVLFWLFLVGVALYAVAGVMMMFSKKIVVSEATDNLDSSRRLSNKSKD